MGTPPDSHIMLAGSPYGPSHPTSAHSQSAIMPSPSANPPINPSAYFTTDPVVDHNWATRSSIISHSTTTSSHSSASPNPTSSIYDEDPFHPPAHKRPKPLS